MSKSGVFRISSEELKEEIVGESKPFPKYTTQILNLCNQNAQGTRPQVVGQMTELIQECPYNSYIEWEKWYRTRKPSAIVDATVRIKRMVDNLKGAIELIDDQMIRSWVEDLVLVKTFVGLRFQAAILSKIAKMKRTTFSLATPTEESKGIDGHIGETPVSIKPQTYKYKASLPESIRVPIIYYTKDDDGIHVDATSIFDRDTTLQ